MAPRLRSGGTARRSPDKMQAQATSTSSMAVAPTGPAAERRGNPRRNALTDITNFANFFDATVEEVENDVDRHEKPNYASSVLRTSQYAFDHYIDYLAVRELRRQGHVELNTEQLAPVVVEMKTQIETGRLSDSLSEVINDKKICVSYLHIYAMTGKGKINNDTIEHTNLRKHYAAVETSSRESRSDRTAPATGTVASTAGSSAQPLAPAPALTLDPALPLDPAHVQPRLASGYDLRSSHISGSQRRSLAEEDFDQESNSEDEFVPADKSLAQESDDADDVEEDEEASTLDAQELELVGAIQARPGATPLALNTIKAQGSRHLPPILAVQHLLPTQPSEGGDEDHAIPGKAKAHVSHQLTEKAVDQRRYCSCLPSWCLEHCRTRCLAKRGTVYSELAVRSHHGHLPR